MEIRLVKTILVVLVALQGLFYGLQNLINLDSALGFVGTVLAMADRPFYAASLVPSITNPTIVAVALGAIVLAELSVGALGLKGAWNMWQNRAASADAFNNAKKFGLLSCGMAMVVWFGFFIVIGGTVFIMWQTEIGGGSLEGAFQLGGVAGLVFLVVNSADH